MSPYYASPTAPHSTEKRNTLSPADRLINIVSNAEQCRVLLRLRGNHAERALAILGNAQAVLKKALTPVNQRHTIVAIQRLAKAANVLPPGQILEGVEKHPQRLGRGGFGDVYKGEYKGKFVCIKSLQVSGERERDDVKRNCAKEAILWSFFDHPNVLKFLGVCEIDDMPCLVSPWAKKGTVKEYLDENSTTDRYRLANEIVAGLQHLHFNNVVHGDLKPDNVLINSKGRALLADFGISSICDPEILKLSSHAELFSMGGTRRWQAPEMAARFFISVDVDQTHNTKASDVWALGCVWYQIFTGHQPYEEHESFAVARAIHGGERPQRPSKDSQAWKSHHLDEAMWKLMESCWTSKPKDRPTTEELAAHLNKRSRKDPSSRRNDKPEKTIPTCLSGGRAKILHSQLDELEGLLHEPDIPTQPASDVSVQPPKPRPAKSRKMENTRKKRRRQAPYSRGSEWHYESCTLPNKPGIMFVRVIVEQTESVPWLRLREDVI